MNQADKCKPLVVGNQTIGVAQCPFHAGGGVKELGCGGNGAHDEDAPIWHRLCYGTQIKYIIEGTASQTSGKVVGCEGNCDHMLYEVKPSRSKKTVKITGYCIVSANGAIWKS